MPAATRIGDDDVPHCSPMVRAEGSPNVLVNNIPWSRETDHNTGHLKAADVCPVHTAPITYGSPTVIVNDLGAGRIGDVITDCTRVAEGSPNVFAGPLTDSPVPMARAYQPPAESDQGFNEIRKRGFPQDMEGDRLSDIAQPSDGFTMDMEANPDTSFFELDE